MTEENQVIYNEELVEEFKNNEEENIQTTFNEDGLDLLVEDGEVENLGAEEVEGIGATGFSIRTTKPGAGNKCYIRKASGGWSSCIQGNPTDKNCDVLSNCVGYATGRFNEIYNEIKGTTGMKYPLNTNAENFIELAKKYGLEVGTTPKVGAIICWQKGATLSGSDGAGHVEVVERVNNSNSIYTSSSGWGSSTPFWNSTRSNSNGKWGIGSGYSFRGFIYNPAVTDEPTPIPEPVDPFPGVSDEELAKRVWAGEFGNGDDRKTRLGSRYSAVQDLVNKGIGKPDAPTPTPTPTPTWTPEEGNIVVPINLIDYKGTKLVQYDDKYEILQIDSRGAVLGAVRGNSRPIWAVLKLDNLKKVD